MTGPPWSGLLEGFGDGILIVDAIDLKVLAANRHALGMFGLRADQVIGLPVIELAVTPEDFCFWEDVAAGLGNAISSISSIRRGDGALIPVERRVAPVRLGADLSALLVVLRDVTDQVRAGEEFERLVAELRATLDSTADAVLVLGSDDSIRAFNKCFTEIWDLPGELLSRRFDKGVLDWMAGAVVDRAAYLERLAAIKGDPFSKVTDLVVLRSGKVLERCVVPQILKERAIGRVFSFRDITDRLRDETRLRLAAKVFERSLDAILIADAFGQLVESNPASTSLTGFGPIELRGRSLSDLFYDADGQGIPDSALGECKRLGFWEGEVWFRRASGTGAPGMASLVDLPAGNHALPDDPADGGHTIVFLRDLSERQAARQRIDELAYSDALTGLPNRTLLNQRIAYSLGIAARDKSPLAILVLDLDRFKQINDSMGHVFGDRVLVEVAARLRASLRAADTASRLGGDEFVLLLHDTDTRGAEIASRRILASLSDPIVIDAMRLSISCSIGIALYPTDGVTLDELTRNADAAMYRAKERGRSGFRFYQPQMNVDLLSRMKLEHAMRQGLPNGAFRLHYQPQVSLSNGRIVGAEALLRWKDPELGEVAPSRFIPVAEESGFIGPLGDWVLRCAVQQAKRWADAGLDLVVAVNVSALQFHQADFVSSVRAVLDESGLPADRIEVELTESILVQDADDALTRLQALSDIGVKMSIDDFGTGYSSLTYLKRFPIQKLKIDRGFVKGLPADDSDVAIARAVVNLGRALRLQTIAEGVETEAQRDFLREAGCNEFQGFLCSPAVPPEAFAALATAANKR